MKLYKRLVYPCQCMKMQLNVAIEEKDLQLVRKVATNRGEGLTDFVRRAIKKELASFGYLNEDEKKALGIDKK